MPAVLKMGAAEIWNEYRKPLLAALGVSVLVWGFLLLAVVAGGLPAANRLLPPAPPVTVPFDTKLQTGSEDLPLELLAKQGGLWDPEQIHLSLAGEFQMHCSAKFTRCAITSLGRRMYIPQMPCLFLNWEAKTRF